ncbi:MAG: glycosyl hydrolase [Acidimicrobiales bacterium]|nr:glycosyl hydrolase [Acidimicrobiales bacterium]
MTLLIGTRKGLFQVDPDREITEPAFLGHIVQHAVWDPIGDRVVAAVRTGHLGPTVMVSDDRGGTWRESTRPPAFRTGEPLARSLRAVFWLTPPIAADPGVWYAGGTPQGLFRSADGGETWEPVDGWNDHPLWPTWCEWPEENTPDGSMLHSVNIDPRDPAHLYLGLSSGGVFESPDRGLSWAPLNQGCAADFFPDPDPEFGHDPHCVRLHPAQPDRLYQQNHCGIYRLDRPGDRWVRIGDNMPAEIGDIGFPIELHPRDPDTVWVFPMDGTDVWPRTSPDGRPAVYRSSDAGASWERLGAGLPERGWFTVKRQAMTVVDADPVTVHFGTTSGEVWSSVDRGESWRCTARHLPEIYSVEHLIR